MRIFVTGQTGFIGAAFCELAKQRGHEIMGLERPARLAEPPWKELARFAPEVSVHAAWIATPGEYLRSPLNADYFRWSRDLIQGLAAVGVRHVLALGTCLEYAVSMAPLREESSVIDPLSEYATAKNELRLALEEGIAGSMAWTWARVFFPFGPHEHRARLCTDVIQSIKAGKPVILRTPASVRDYIYRDDIATALLALLETPLTGVVNIGTGQSHAVGEIATTICEMMGAREGPRFESNGVVDPFPHIVADVSRLLSTGWQSQWNLEAGLSKLIASLP